MRRTLAVAVALEELSASERPAAAPSGANPALQQALSELAYAVERTSFFRAHLAAAGFGVSGVRTAEDFASIPPTSKDDFRRGFPSCVLASGFAIDDSRLLRTQSSGTGGERLTTLELPAVYSARALRSAAANPNLYEAITADPHRHVRLAAPNCSSVDCAIPASIRPHDEAPQGGPLIVKVNHDLLTTPRELWISGIEQIERLQPRFYYADPAHISELALQAEALDYALFPAPVLLTYSLATQICRRQIRVAMPEPVPTTAVLSMSELGWLAVECPLGSLHLNTDSYYVEFLRSGRAAGAGEVAEFLVTTLDHGCTPRIRYRTQDLLTPVASGCPCGNRYPVVQMEGRLQDCIIRDRALVLSPRGLDELMGAPDWLDRYQLHQIDETRFRLQLIVNARCAPGDADALADNLRDHLGADAEIQLDLVRYIAAGPSGKLPACTSAVARRCVAEGWVL